MTSGSRRGRRSAGSPDAPGRGSVEITFGAFKFFPPFAPLSHLLLGQFLEHDVAHDAEGDVHHLEVALAQEREEPEGQAQVYQLVEQLRRLDVPGNVMLGVMCSFSKNALTDSLSADGDQRRVDVGRGQVGVEVGEHLPHPLVDVRGHFGGKFNLIFLTFTNRLLQLIAGVCFCFVQEGTQHSYAAFAQPFRV